MLTLEKYPITWNANHVCVKCCVMPKEDGQDLCELCLEDTKTATAVELLQEMDRQILSDLLALSLALRRPSAPMTYLSQKVIVSNTTF